MGSRVPAGARQCLPLTFARVFERRLSGRLPHPAHAPDLFAEAHCLRFVKTFLLPLSKDKANKRRGVWRHGSERARGRPQRYHDSRHHLLPQIVALIARDFSPEKAQLATTLTRLMLPFILLARSRGPMGCSYQIHFAFPASGSTLFNVGSIVVVWRSPSLSGGIGKPTLPDVCPRRGAVAIMEGDLTCRRRMQFLIQVPSLRRVGFRFRPLISFTHPGVRQVMRLMGPAVIGTAAVQINVLINTFYASNIEGGVSWLSYAFRLMQFPIGVFGVASAPPRSRRFPLRARGYNRGLSCNTLPSLASFSATIPFGRGLMCWAARYFTHYSTRVFPLRHGDVSSRFRPTHSTLATPHSRSSPPSPPQRRAYAAGEISFDWSRRRQLFLSRLAHALLLRTCRRRFTFLRRARQLFALISSCGGALSGSTACNTSRFSPHLLAAARFAAVTWLCPSTASSANPACSAVYETLFRLWPARCLLRGGAVLRLKIGSRRQRHRGVPSPPQILSPTSRNAHSPREKP